MATGCTYSPTMVVIAVPLLALFTILNALGLMYLSRVVVERSEGTRAPVSSVDPPKELPVDLSTPFYHRYVENDGFFGLSNSPETIARWDMLLGYHNGPLYEGVLGESNRYVVTMFHQLHCMRYFRGAFQKGMTEEGLKLNEEQQEHIPHCLNYLIQGILCAADTTLEWQKEPYVLGTGPFVNHTCRDWTKVYKALDDEFWS